MKGRILLFLMVALGIAGCADESPLRVGFLGGLSGRASDLGEAGRNGALLAVEQRNAAGGVNDRPVELVVRDDRQDDATALKMIEELIALPVEAMIGPMTSSITATVLPVANREGLNMVSPTATFIDLVGKDDQLIRINGTTRDYAHAYADYYFNNTDLRRVALTYDIGNRAFSESWRKEFTAAFTRLGGEVTIAVPFQSGPDAGFSDIVKQLLETDPDVLFFISGAVDTVRLTQQARRLAPEVPLIAAEWSATERLFELGGRDVEGLMLAQTYNRDSQSESYLAFRSAYLARFGQQPGFASVNGYDAANIVMDVLAAGGSGERFKNTLFELNPFDGVQRVIEFDRFGDTESPAYFTVVRQGKFVLVE